MISSTFLKSCFLTEEFTKKKKNNNPPSKYIYFVAQKDLLHIYQGYVQDIVNDPIVRT